MNIKVEQGGIRFIPITVSLTVTTEEELAVIFAIFNHTEIANIIDKHCNKGTSHEIREAIKKANNGFTPPYELAHSELRRIFAKDC